MLFVCCKVLSPHSSFVVYPLFLYVVNASKVIPIFFCMFDELTEAFILKIPDRKSVGHSVRLVRASQHGRRARIASLKPTQYTRPARIRKVDERF